MSNQEVLERAIQKAIDGGWDMKYRGSSLWNVRELSVTIADYPLHNSPEALLFNHDFAKALWGEDLVQNLDYRQSITSDVAWVFPAWQYHLQQMVIADDPIKYLGENI